MSEMLKPLRNQQVVQTKKNIGEKEQMSNELWKLLVFQLYKEASIRQLLKYDIAGKTGLH